MDQPVNDDSLRYLTRQDGERLAYKQVHGTQVGGDGPTVIWIGGFRSDMEGTKALALDAAARDGGWPFLRYDHFAHGQSSGDWKAATIGRWREDAIAVIDRVAGPVVLVGSSMGGWIALLAALARPETVAGIVLINPAQDFTERLMWPGLADHERQAILRDGETTVVEEGLGAYALTRNMFDEAKSWMLLDGPIAISAPVHILQGRADQTVPWTHAMALVEQLKGGDVRLDLIEGGDHRLSSPADIARLIAAVEAMRPSEAAAGFPGAAGRSRPRRR